MAKPKAKAKRQLTKRNIRRATSTTLTARESRFIDEFLVDLNGTQAAIRARYSKKTARFTACRLLAKPEIADEVARRRQQISAELQISANDIARELAKLGFANMADYMKVGKDGDPHLDFTSLTRDQTAALSEVTVDDFLDGRGEDSREVRRVKFKLCDKRASLDSLAKILGYIRERHEHSGPNGSPIETHGTIRIEFVKPSDDSSPDRI